MILAYRIEVMDKNFTIFFVMRGSFHETGFYFSNFSQFGGSVASAKDANESIIMFTHRS